MGKKGELFFGFLIVIIFFTFSGRSFAKELVWVAHRGGNVEADENTLKSYRTASSYGFQHVECDPRLTRDRGLISMHDPKVDRTTNGKGNVRDLTLAEIKSFRTKNGEQVPSIEEILNFAKGAGIGVYLDTKELKDMDYLDKLTALVIQTGMSKNVIVGVWTTQQLKWMHEHHPEMTTCISWPWPAQTLGQARERGAVWVGTLVSIATPSMIKSAHKHGLKVITLEINDPAVIQKKIQAGIDAIQTDNPQLRKQFVK